MRRVSVLLALAAVTGVAQLVLAVAVAVTR